MLPPSLLVFSKRESASPIRCAVSKLGKVGAWLERESPQLEKLSHDCEGCLQTVHKLPVNTQEIWKISQPTPFLCFPRKDHYARRADWAETCCRVRNFLHCDQVLSFGSGELGDWNFSLKRSVHCSQKVCHLKWYHGTLSYFCKARVQKPQSRGLVVNEVSS